MIKLIIRALVVALAMGAIILIIRAIVVALAMGAELVCGAITEPDYRPCAVCGA